MTVIEDIVDLEVKITDLLFNKVERSVRVEKPKLITENIYTNQEKTIDPENLKLNHVLFLGAGSVGSHAIFQLNRLGVSSFSLYDFDVIEAHNSASAIYGYNWLNNRINSYSDDRARVLNSTFNNTLASILDYNRTSPFKIDRMHEIIMEHDPQANVELFKTGYGYNMKSTMEVFENSLQKYDMPMVYSKRDGRIKADWEIEIDYERVTTERLMQHTNPNIAVFTVDTVQGRLESFEILRNRVSQKQFPLIDACVDSSLHGQVFCFDIFNDDDAVKWINSMFPEKYRYTDVENALSDIKDGSYKEKIINFNDAVICGDKMSIISGVQSATIICSLFAELFRDGTKPQFDTVPKMYNWSFIGKYYNPTMTVQDTIVP